MTLPSFVIGGAPRSGTTWLARALDEHPDVWMSKPLRPEPKFFLVDDVYANGLDWYADKWFAAAPRAPSSARRARTIWRARIAAARLGSDLPDAKPRLRAARASGPRWSQLPMVGHERDGDRGLRTALRLEAERERTLPTELRYARPHAYFARGCYAELLTPYFEHFERKQIHCLRFEDLVADPVSTVSGRARVPRCAAVARVDRPVRRYQRRDQGRPVGAAVGDPAGGEISRTQPGAREDARTVVRDLARYGGGEMNDRPVIVVITPVFNEEENLARLCRGGGADAPDA